ncbi:MAG TPA: hypothetical protein VES42_27555 [Pilimelia sp.]|nr:hypothetical protein [Pilimelia sp.]
MDPRHDPAALDAVLRAADGPLLRALEDTIDVGDRLRRLKAAAAAPPDLRWAYELMETERQALVAEAARLLTPPRRRWGRHAPGAGHDHRMTEHLLAERVVAEVHRRARTALPVVQPASKAALRRWLTTEMLLAVRDELADPAHARSAVGGPARAR